MVRTEHRQFPRRGRHTVAVLIADDHPVVRQGLKQILADTPDIAVGGEATTAPELLEHIRGECTCDVICLDLAMPGTSGVDLLRAVRRERPGLPVLVLSMQPEDQYAVRVLKAGAAGYLTKECAPDALVEALRTVYAGGKYVSAALAERLVVDLVNPAGRPAHELLSDREYQVLCLLAKGMPIKQVARELHLSVKTISTYRVRALDKMAMKTTADLIRFAIQNRLVD